jgi:endonuclease YncB( thermonuclease family)
MFRVPLCYSSWTVGLLLFATPAAAQSGPARVIDGDTIAIGEEHFRLFGIDAPEHDQTCQDGGGQVYACGTAATDALRSMVGNQAVTCKGLDVDRYGRTVAVCSIAGVGDLGQQLVAWGLAVAYVHFSKRYLPDQAAAQTAHRGLWAGQFVMPWDWRKLQRAAH